MGSKDAKKPKDPVPKSAEDALNGMSSTERILRRIHDLYAIGLVLSPIHMCRCRRTPA